MLITKRRLTAAIHFLPDHGIVYLNNAKVACSSIKKSLWLSVSPESYSDSPHDRSQFSVFAPTLEAIAAEQDRFDRSTFFTVVRNPFVRILSAYLDKVYVAKLDKPSRDAAVWFPFARRFRLSGNSVPSFSEFVKLITSERPSLLDQHFAPQHLNVLSDFVSPHFVGHLETMDTTAAFLNERGIALAHHAPHVTKATSSVSDFYTARDIELVAAYYQRDFELFGYSDDPSVLAPVRPVVAQTGNSDALRLAVGCYTALSIDSRRKCIDVLRRLVPSVSTPYIAMETGVLPFNDLRALGDQAIRGELDNWKLVAKIGQELAAHDMIPEASSVMHRANLLMHPK